MQVEVRYRPGTEGIRVVVEAERDGPEVRALVERLMDLDEKVLLGRLGEQVIPLCADSLLRCYAQGGRVKAENEQGTYDLKERLYELENKLDRHVFVRISHSEIINLRKITALDLSLTGTIRITLEGGTECYISRRFVKKIKEALELS